MKRLGYYVEGKYFAGRKAQAVAFASFRATEYGRPVDVIFVGDTTQSDVVGTAVPTTQEVTAAERAA